jgi:glycosyltransferase involved in cell wall biosynthesis
MKILVYTHEFYPFSGGIANWTLEIVKGLKNLGQDVTVLAPKYNKKPYDLPELREVRIKRMPLAIRGRLSYFIGIVFFTITFFSKKYDKVIICDNISQVVGTIVSFFIKAEYIVIVNGTEILMHFSKKNIYQKIKAGLITSFFSRAKIISISRATRNLLFEKGGYFDNVEVLYCSIDKRMVFAKSSSDVLMKQMSLEDRKIILTIARLYPRKGHDVVLQALVEIKKKFPEILYLIVGEGFNRKYLEEIVASLNLTDNVIFTGEVPDVIDYLDICNVFVMASREEEGVEGFGIVYLEAMARGKPVIGSRHGGVPEVISDGVSGYLIDPHDVSEIASTIIRVLSDSNEARKMGENGRKMVELNFTTDLMARKLLHALIDTS